MFLQHYIHISYTAKLNMLKFSWILVDELFITDIGYVHKLLIFVNLYLYSTCAFCTKSILVNTVMSLATVFCILCNYAFHWAMCWFSSAQYFPQWTICIIMWPVLWHMSVMNFALSIIEKVFVFVNILKVIIFFLIPKSYYH